MNIQAKDIIRKIPVAIILDLLVILVVGVMLLILMSGGIVFALGSLTVSVRSLKNPAIALLLTLILRKIVLGRFWGQFVCLSGFRERFVTSRRFRGGVVLFPLLLLPLIAMLNTINPLQRGLNATYYDNTEWTGSPFLTARERRLDLSRMYIDYPEGFEEYSITWEGALLVPTPGDYDFFVYADDGAEILIDDQEISRLHEFGEPYGQNSRVYLEQGFHSLTARYLQRTTSSDLKVLWKHADEKTHKSLDDNLFFAVQPTERELWIGRRLELAVFLCKFLIAGSLLLGICSIPVWWPLLASSSTGSVWRRCRAWLIRSGVPRQAFPKTPQNMARPFLIALFCYAVLTVIWTYPLIVYFSTRLTGWGGDRYTYLWNMWWLKKALTLGTNLLHTDYLYYPEGIHLAFHDFSLLLTGLSLPLQPFLTLTEIYNLFFLLSFVLAGGGCFLLVRYLTGDNLAAFFAGLVFTFWGGRAYYTDHLYLATIQWIPFSIYYLLKTLREDSYRYPVLAAVFFVLNALTSWVYAVFMTIFVVLLLGYSAWTERSSFFTAARLRRIVLIGLLFLVGLSPLLYPMIQQILEGQEYMNAALPSNASATLGTAFFPGVDHQVLGKFVRSLYVKAGVAGPQTCDLTANIFIGYTVVLLCLYTGIRLRHLQPHFWSMAALFSLVLAFGPHLQIVPGQDTGIPLLYGWLYRTPLLKTARIPERFMIIVMFCCSVLAGYACWDVFRRVRFRKMVFLLLALVMGFEFSHAYTIKPIEPAPQFYQELGHDQEPYAILELTQLTELPHVARLVTLHQISHEKKLCTGFVARVPPEVFQQAYRFYRAFDDLFVLPEDTWKQADPSLIKIDRERLLSLLTYYNVRYVTLYDDYGHGEFPGNTERLSELFGPPVGGEQQGMYVFQVEKLSATGNIVFPGHGMFPLYPSPEGEQIRQASQDADIRMLNLDDSQHMQFQFEGKRDVQAETDLRVQISVNDELITTVTIGAEWQQVTLPPLPLQAGENVIQFSMLDIPADEWWRSMYMRTIRIDFF